MSTSYLKCVIRAALIILLATRRHVGTIASPKYTVNVVPFLGDTDKIVAPKST